MWGPILAWCALELLGEAVDEESPARAALDLFDRLRLRRTLGEAFRALGFEGEEAWRVAARIKVVLLASAGVGRAEEPHGKPATAADGRPANSLRMDTNARAQVDGKWAVEKPASEAPDASLAADLWLDPDVRWLTGVHEAEGHEYLIRERYEELLWWMVMPSLLRVAESPTPSRVAIEDLSRTVERALAKAEAAGYRADVLSGRATPAKQDEPKSETKSKTKSETKTGGRGLDESEAGKAKSGESGSEAETHAAGTHASGAGKAK
jgi:hypothetical protein